MGVRKKEWRAKEVAVHVLKKEQDLAVWEQAKQDAIDAGKKKKPPKPRAPRHKKTPDWFVWDQQRNNKEQAQLAAELDAEADKVDEEADEVNKEEQEWLNNKVFDFEMPGELGDCDKEQFWMAGEENNEEGGKEEEDKDIKGDQ
jgi:hypothetical protein